MPRKEPAWLSSSPAQATILSKEISTMKKTFLGLFASLMVAGALSAASGLTTTTHPTAEAIVMIGDGTSPILMSAIPVDAACDHSSHNK